MSTLAAAFAKPIVKWSLAALAAVIIFVAIWTWWDNLLAAMPWSTESQLTNTQNELDITKADQALQDTQSGERGAIYGRDRDYIIQQPIIIRQAETAAARAENATSEHDATDAFYDGVCTFSVAARDPSCVAQNDSRVSQGGMH